jgi:hypothetical protein
MNFYFQESRSPRRKRLFVPLSGFSFASFIVPIKFRQPAFASRWIESVRVGITTRSNAVFPRPKGEGQGEGERGAIYSTARRLLPANTTQLRARSLDSASN